MPTITAFPYEEIREYQEQLEKLKLTEKYKEDEEARIKISKHIKIEWELKELAPEAQKLFSRKVQLLTSNVDKLPSKIFSMH